MIEEVAFIGVTLRETVNAPSVPNHFPPGSQVSVTYSCVLKFLTLEYRMLSVASAINTKEVIG